MITETIAGLLGGRRISPESLIKDGEQAVLLADSIKISKQTLDSWSNEIMTTFLSESVEKVELLKKWLKMKPEDLSRILNVLLTYGNGYDKSDLIDIVFHDLQENHSNHNYIPTLALSLTRLLEMQTDNLLSDSVKDAMLKTLAKFENHKNDKI